MQARHLIRYVPFPVHGPGVSLPAGMAALLYLDIGGDIFGWYAHASRTRYTAAFFMMEKFYAQRVSMVARSMEDDVHGPWERELPSPVQEIRNPVPEALGHELERLQSAFIDEWLFFPDDPQSMEEVARYQRASLPLFAFNVRGRRLSRLTASGRGFSDGAADKHGEWLHLSAGADPNIHDMLQKCWRPGEAALYRLPENFSARSGSAL